MAKQHEKKPRDFFQILSVCCSLGFFVKEKDGSAIFLIKSFSNKEQKKEPRQEVLFFISVAEIFSVSIPSS